MLIVQSEGINSSSVVVVMSDLDVKRFHADDAIIVNSLFIRKNYHTSVLVLGSCTLFQSRSSIILHRCAH